jgi:hypothetical protein
MARTNFQYEKRQRELEKKRRAAEKARRRLEAKQRAGDDPAGQPDGSRDGAVLTPDTGTPA